MFSTDWSDTIYFPHAHAGCESSLSLDRHLPVTNSPSFWTLDIECEITSQRAVSTTHLKNILSGKKLLKSVINNSFDIIPN